MDDIHLIQIESNYLCYNIDSYSLSKLDKASFLVISNILSGYDISSIKEIYKLDDNDVIRINQLLGNNEKLNKTAVYKREQISRIVNRITLHVSNDCNLRCKYCYASGGNYSQERTLMTSETADSFIDFCITNFDQVQRIVFFGGEPFLNPSIIEYICNTFRQKFKNHDIPFCPEFGAITNGMILTDKVRQIIAEYFSFITISIDGAKDINDSNRVTATGLGSFNHIDRFIREVRVMPNLSVSLEATYTQKHIDLGYTIRDLEQYFKNTYNLRCLIREELSLQKSKNRDKSDILEFYENEYIRSVFSAFRYKKPRDFCSITRHIIDIDVAGNLFPCHLDVGNPNNCLGNIKASNCYNSLDSYISKYNWLATNFKDNEACSRCWARNLCGGCTRIKFYKDETNEYGTEPNPERCKEIQKNIERALYRLSIIQQAKQ